MYKVAVIMSTYNGEKYIQEQLDSILEQKGVSTDIFIRDDGSGDGTLEILESYRKYPNIHITAGNNIGAARSFMAAIANVNESHHYISLADQDDIWNPDKLEIACKTIDESSNDIPSLYMSNALCIDNNNRELGLLIKTNRQPGPYNASIQCFSLGATMVFNTKAARILLYAYPLHLTMHDWWIYLVLSFTGTVIYDEKVTMKYRQHDSNVYGYQSTMTYIISNYKSILKAKKLQQAREQVADLLVLYGDRSKNPVLTKEMQDFVKEKNLLRSIIYAVRNPMYKKNSLGTLAAKIQTIILNTGLLNSVR